MRKSSERFKETNSVSSLACNVADDGKGQRNCVFSTTFEMKPDHAIHKCSRFFTLLKFELFLTQMLPLIIFSNII